MAPVTVVGEAIVDYLPDAGGALVGWPGGSPANVARGLARLGRQVRLRTVLGDDEPGRLLLESLTADRVEVDPASRRPGPSSTAVATLDAQGQATYDLDVRWDPGALPLDADTGWLHTGSLAAVTPPGADDVARLLARAAAAGVPTSLDLNIREPLPWGMDATRRHLHRLAGHCKVVKASEDDLARLTPGRDRRDVARDWLRGERTALVVVTLGARGAWAATDDHEVEVLAPAVRLVDTVGAGDAFMAALIDGLMADGLLVAVHPSAERLTAVLRRAAVAAAICCEREGCDPPSRADLAAALP